MGRGAFRDDDLRTLEKAVPLTEIVADRTDLEPVGTTGTALRTVSERGNSLLKTTFKALRHVSLDPSRIGDITAAALAILHVRDRRTT